MPCLQRIAYIPADNLLGIVVGYHGQIAEDVFVFADPYRDVRDVSNPYLVLACRDEFLDEIDSWIIDILKGIGCDTAKSVLALSRDELIKRTDLEEETVDAMIAAVKEELDITEENRIEFKIEKGSNTETLADKLKEMIDEWREDQFINNTNHSPWAIFKNDYRDIDYYLDNLHPNQLGSEMYGRNLAAAILAEKY